MRRTKSDSGAKREVAKKREAERRWLRDIKVPSDHYEDLSGDDVVLAPTTPLSREGSFSSSYSIPALSLSSLSLGGRSTATLFFFFFLFLFQSIPRSSFFCTASSVDRSQLLTRLDEALSMSKKTEGRIRPKSGKVVKTYSYDSGRALFTENCWVCLRAHFAGNTMEEETAILKEERRKYDSLAAEILSFEATHSLASQQVRLASFLTCNSLFELTLLPFFPPGSCLTG